MKAKPNRFLCIVFLAISIPGIGQAWEFVYDSIATMGRKVILTSDSNYLVTAVNNEFEDDNLSIKLDQEGNIIWMSPNGGFAVTQTHDNKYVIAGSHIPYGVLKKINAKGELEWNRHYGGGSQEEYTAVIESSDSCFVTCGYSHNHGDSTFFVMKTDNNGDIIWTRSFPSLSQNGFRDIVEFGHHYYVIGREYGEDYPPFYLFIVKLTMSGATRWQKTYETGWTGESIAVSPDSALIVAGGSILTKINTNGDTLWTKTLSPAWKVESIAVTPDNTYILSGGDTYPYAANVLSELDSEGNRLWIKHYPTLYTAYWGSFPSVQCTHDGGFIACGYSLYTSKTETRLRVIKTDGTGNIIVGNEEVEDHNFFSIYPNPASRQLTIGQLDSRSFRQSAVSLSIVDLFGREILSPGNISILPFHIDISNLPDGVYFLKMTDESGNLHSAKFVKVIGGK